MIYDQCVMGHKNGPRTAVDGAYLCTTCLDHLGYLVARMPARHRQLERVLAAGGTCGNSGHVSGSSAEPLVINPAVAAHRADMSGVLASWARLVAEDRGITPPSSPAIGVCAPWLAVHVTWCAGNQWVDEMLTEMRRLDGRARSLLDPDRRLPTGERCRAVGENGERCSGLITMSTGSDDLMSARCSACGPVEMAPYMHEGIAGRWVTWERVQSYALTRHGVRIKGDAVRQWAKRGHIRAMEEYGSVWYELASVERYLAGRNAVAS